MADELKRLETLLSHTNSELNRADAKFRNVGTINSLMIGALVATLLYVLRYVSHGSATYISMIILITFFIAINVSSIVIAIYGVWPRKRFAHTAYDLRYIAKGKLIKEENFIEKFTQKDIKQMIRINAIVLKKKRALSKASMFLTVFPFSIGIVLIIMKQDKKLRTLMVKRRSKK